MKRFILLAALCCAGCGDGWIVKPDAPQPSTPIVKALALADITEALAARIPASIADSDYLDLVLADMVTAKDLTDTQAKQIKSSLDNIGSMRPLTSEDALKVKGVK